MSAKETIQLFGAEDGTFTMHWFSPVAWQSVDVFYKPEGRCTQGPRAGSSTSYAMCDTLAEAREKLARLMADPVESARYDDWYIVRCQPLIQTSIVEDKDDR